MLLLFFKLPRNTSVWFVFYIQQSLTISHVTYQDIPSQTNAKSIDLAETPDFQNDPIRA